ncbi:MULTISPECIES: hypothetical protein [unclassified Streptomyces]|uniref:hypothetical protein n=1 Tax=unclassified Streptomyces TaxID=2593676 RepID=UPI0033D37AA8
MTANEKIGKGAGHPADALLVAELVGLLGDAENYIALSTDERLRYLERRAESLHRLVDALGDEASRYLASDAEDRAEQARNGAEVLAEECGDPRPVPTKWVRRR